MDLLQAVILGIVQGLTEFLPVSSSGHLVVFQKILGIEHHDLAFDVAAHLGTLLAVFTVYRRSLMMVGKEVLNFPKKREMTNATWLFLVVLVGSVPTAAIGLSLKDLFESLFSNLYAVSGFFVFTGILLFFTDRFQIDGDSTDFNKLDNVKKLTFKKAIVIGVAQGMAIAPGVSRAGATIATSLYLGIDRQTAALYSFMLSIPAVLGAGILQLKDIQTYSPQVIQALTVGFFTSYLAGLAGLWGLLYLVGRGRLKYFSYYLWILGGSLLISQL